VPAATRADVIVGTRTSAINVGVVTTVDLDIAKDNLQFGIRAVDSDGHRSAVAFPAAAA
jgi:hypothetical protein